MSSQINAIFQGVPPSDSRNALGEFIKKNVKDYSTFVVPCAGRFAAAETMVKTGADPGSMLTSDISLFSAIMGKYITDEDLNDLDIKINDKDVNFLTSYFNGGLDHAAASLLAIKYAITADKNHYLRAIKKEMLQNWQVYFDGLKEQLVAHKEILDGIKYETADVWTVIEKWMDADGALIYINPPAYKGGYTKMFDTHNKVEWNEPQIPEFDPARYKEMLEDLTDAKATAIIYRYQTTDEVPDGWETFYARNYSMDRTDFLVCNKPTNVKSLIRKRDHVQKSKYPIFTDKDEITKWSKVSVVSASREESAYYRDLFIHRLGAASADANFLMLIDGKIFTVFGIGLRQAFNGYGYIHETYGISVPSKRYPTINRLFMKLMTCKDFKPDLEAHINFGLSDWRGIKTACLARLPEVRINHGIMKLVHKERTAKKFGGLWKLDYYTDLWPKTYKMAIIEWQDEIAKKERLKNANKSKQSTRGTGNGPGEGEGKGPGRDQGTGEETGHEEEKAGSQEKTDEGNTGEEKVNTKKED